MHNKKRILKNRNDITVTLKYYSFSQLQNAVHTLSSTYTQLNLANSYVILKRKKKRWNDEFLQVKHLRNQVYIMQLMFNLKILCFKSEEQSKLFICWKSKLIKHTTSTFWFFFSVIQAVYVYKLLALPS